jgi:hypothetical protein
MSGLAALTIFHVILSLIAIIAGVALARGLISGQRSDRWTQIFMVTTAITVLTGFVFPYHGFTPGIGVGIVCVLVFIPTALARYRFQMAGLWRPVFIVGALALFYFNCLVFVVQSFQKIPPLNAYWHQPAVSRSSGLCKQLSSLPFWSSGFSLPALSADDGRILAACRIATD